MSNITTFKVLNTQKDDDMALAEPILASFPSNIPSYTTLSRLHFSIY
jgi:hypothetical protein